MVNGKLLVQGYDEMSIEQLTQSINLERSYLSIKLKKNMEAEQFIQHKRSGQKYKTCTTHFSRHAQITNWNTTMPSRPFFTITTVTPLRKLKKSVLNSIHRPANRGCRDHLVDESEGSGSRKIRAWYHPTHPRYGKRRVSSLRRCRGRQTKKAPRHFRRSLPKSRKSGARRAVRQTFDPRPVWRFSDCQPCRPCDQRQHRLPSDSKIKDHHEICCVYCSTNIWQFLITD